MKGERTWRDITVGVRRMQNSWTRQLEILVNMQISCHLLLLALFTIIFNNDGSAAFPLLLWLYMCPSTKIQPPGKSGVAWKLEMTKILKKMTSFSMHFWVSTKGQREFQGLRQQWSPQEITTLLLGADIFKGEPRQQKDKWNTKPVWPRVIQKIKSGRWNK